MIKDFCGVAVGQVGRLGRGMVVSGMAAFTIGCVSLGGGIDTVDLSSPESGIHGYAPTGPSWGLPDVPTNLSGITWSPHTNGWFLIRNSDAIAHEYEADLLTLRRTITLTDAPDDDFEGIVHLGGTTFAIATELNRVLIADIPDGDVDITLSLDPAQDEVQLIQLPERGSWNAGIEGLCFDPASGPNGTLFAIQEKSPRRLFRFPRPSGSANIAASSDPALLGLDEPFDAETALAGIVSDLSGCEFDPTTGHLLIISHGSSRLIEVKLDSTATLVSSRGLPGYHGGGASQYEGVAFGPGRVLAVASEPFFGTHPSRVRFYAAPPP